jgi:hypothetical protein
MLIAEVLIVLFLFDVAAGVELAVDRTLEEWSPLYWLQLAAASGSVAYGLFALSANRELVGEFLAFLPHVVAFLVLLLPVGLVLLAYAATFTMVYWTYHLEDAG